MGTVSDADGGMRDTGLVISAAGTCDSGVPAWYNEKWWGVVAGLQLICC